MTLEMQVRLLRVLETGRFVRVGGDGEIRTNVRVLAATNRDALMRCAMAGCAKTSCIGSPSSRSRCRRCASATATPSSRRTLPAEPERRGGTAKRFSRAALTTIRAYHWPGNVRELKNAVHRAFIMAEDVVELDLAGLACPAVEGECLRMPVGTSLAEMERQAIFATLDHCRGNKRRAAEMLGVSLKTLYNRLTAYQADGARLASM